MSPYGSLLVFKPPQFHIDIVRKLCTRWIPHNLTETQKLRRINGCRETMRKDIPVRTNTWSRNRQHIKETGSHPSGRVVNRRELRSTYKILTSPFSRTGALSARADLQLFNGTPIPNTGYVSERNDLFIHADIIIWMRRLLRPTWLQHKDGPALPVKYPILTEFGREVAASAVDFFL
ncbi:hypothetical protein EVAR_90343_1 [Eumeta japonica]|uniref:Uncharacterized protein n=1 Tax=Eumeta variegata TaxID=151549 RepID=A0A4C1YJL8_EUMVA|nr:hypothetical protein EVAR_90343_1 [Eumeta japonica]